MDGRVAVAEKAQAYQCAGRCSWGESCDDCFPLYVSPVEPDPFGTYRDDDGSLRWWR